MELPTHAIVPDAGRLPVPGRGEATGDVGVRDTLVVLVADRLGDHPAKPAHASDGPSHVTSTVVVVTELEQARVPVTQQVERDHGHGPRDPGADPGARHELEVSGQEAGADAGER